MTTNVLILISLLYAGLLFWIAYYADRASNRHERSYWLNSPIVYTLSLSVYCTAWTFYGAVGSAARSGLEFLAIYIGPSLMFLGYWIILRRVVRLGHVQNITSIADFLSSRFGKSNGVAVIVTLLSLAATTPYISLQLQSIAQSFTIFFQESPDGDPTKLIAFLASVILGVFTIFFGTRHARVNERHHGVVVAIAFESLVKIAAVLIVGIYLIIQFGGIERVFDTVEAEQLLAQPIFSVRWFSLLSVSFMAVLVLPRMFHVIVVENENENDLLTASWAFPLYLLLLNVLVLPVAIIGLRQLGSETNPDYFLITLPLNLDKQWLAYLAFIGGLSAATSMIIVTAIAVATMVSNHIATTLWLDTNAKNFDPDDLNRTVLRIRRLAILFIMMLGFLYFDIAGNSPSLASVGLIAFIGVAQIFPSLMAALFWRGATRMGAILALSVGSLTWVYTLLLPSLGQVFSQDVLISGPFGWSWLAPHRLFGVVIDDPAVHGIFWSLFANVLTLFFVSVFTKARPIERMQANQFVDIYNPLRESAALRRQSDKRIEDYYVLAQRVLNQEGAEKTFAQISEAQGRAGDLPIANDFFFDRFERALGGVVGSAAAHTLISQFAGAAYVPVSETIKLADETVQNIQYARALEDQRKELQSTAKALQKANASLMALDAQKDAFLSQISHELRTPMTAIRSFTEILLEEKLTANQRRKMLEIIVQENNRLTTLLDEILDLSYLESGRVRMARDPHDLRDILKQAIHSTEPVWKEANMEIVMEWKEQDYIALCDRNRLLQVFINLITNAAKYVNAPQPELRIQIKSQGKHWCVDFADNGAGVPKEERAAVFEKFSRGGADDMAGSAGLGLAISREIAQNMGGKLELMPSVQGACFRVSLLRA